MGPHIFSPCPTFDSDKSAIIWKPAALVMDPEVREEFWRLWDEGRKGDGNQPYFTLTGKILCDRQTGHLALVTHDRIG